MEITWYGHSCFSFSEEGFATVVADPYNHEVVGYAPLNVEAEIVTISHNSSGHNCLSGIKGNPFIIDGAGEYELGNVFITGVQTDRKEAHERNTLFVYQFNDLTIAHMGGMTKLPNQKQIEKLGNINIALIPVGGQDGWNANKASELVSMIEPDYLIPMHYATDESKVNMVPLQKFLKEMGADSPQREDVFKIKSINPPVMDETVVVVLNYQE
ncbi:MAG: MBL fold metallo-hydrolase [Anaerolineaceae bacterium]|nr:MBL fold metallo-hydrolase [Anaerolineaceae bacterium]